MRGFETELQSLVKASGESFLHEIGCGEGYWTIQWARQGLTVRGSDFSEIAISLARENADRQGVNVPFSVKSIYDLDSTTDGAPLLVCCEVLEHLENPHGALEKLRVAAQRYVIVSVPREPIWGILNMARGKYWRSLGNTPGHLQRWNRRQFTSLVSEFFEIVGSARPVALDNAPLQKAVTRRFLRWVGHGLAVLGAYFVVWRMWGHASDVLAKSASPLVWLGVVALSVVYALTGLQLAWAWWMALGGLGESRLSWRKTWRLYARTQIAKYLPGNVFHLAGRHIAAREEGVKDTLLVMAAGLEMGMLMFSAGALGLLALDHLLSFFGRVPWLAILVLLSAGALASGGALILWRERIAGKMRHLHWRRLALAQLGYGFFILMSAVLFLGVCMLVGADK